MYLPSATVERTPVAKTIANAARLSMGELLFSTLSPLSGMDREYVFPTPRCSRGFTKTVCIAIWTNDVPRAYAYSIATQKALETRNVPMAIEDLFSTIADRNQMPAPSKQKKTPARHNTTRSASPYTIKNLDAAIAHLEHAIRIDCTQSVFGRNYWHARVRQASLTPTITPAQLRRLDLLLVATSVV